MGLKAGIVGFPNIGKSTIFNALTKSAIHAEIYFLTELIQLKSEAALKEVGKIR